MGSRFGWRREDQPPRPHRVKRFRLDVGRPNTSPFGSQRITRSPRPDGWKPVTGRAGTSRRNRHRRGIQPTI